MKIYLSQFPGNLDLIKYPNSSSIHLIINFNHGQITACLTPNESAMVRELLKQLETEKEET